MSTAHHLRLVNRYSAPNYDPLPVVVATAQGAWITDLEGRRYFDALAGYSALNFGHRHPALVRAAAKQLRRVTLTSRAFHHDQFGLFCEELADLCQMDSVLPMNTGAEAIETAVKAARRWGYRVRGVPSDQATIVVAAGNFHGRTTTIVSFSTDPLARDGFGPFTPGFRVVPYGDVEAIRDAIDDSTVAVLLEPIQGEAGVIIPPHGYLRRVREVTRQAGVLLVADEIQSGLGRTGRTFACEREGIAPDLYVLGKALGGGIVPLSAVVGRSEVMNVFSPGSHGSTFGGNPLACAVGRAVIQLLRTGDFQQHAARLGQRLKGGLDGLDCDGVSEIRSIGLWAAIDVVDRPARAVVERLLQRGVLAKDVHERTIRLAPPLVATESEIDMLLERCRRALAERP